MAASLDERLVEVFADAFETTPNKITPTMNASNTETWDSMRAIVLASSIEAEFDIEFSDAELVELDSYEKVRRQLVEKGVVSDDGP